MSAAEQEDNRAVTGKRNETGRPISELKEGYASEFPRLIKTGDTTTRKRTFSAYSAKH